MSGPGVDILMAACNGGRYVADQVASIELQDERGWHLLVSDDGSTDDTVPLVRAMAADDPRISLVSEGVAHGSATANFMSLLARSQAPYAMPCDQDDVWLPGKVGRSLAAMRALEGRWGADVPLLVFADMRVVDEGLRPIADSFERMQAFDPTRLSLPQLLAQNVAAGCTMLANRALVRLACKAPDDARLLRHDWWLALVAAAFGHIAFVDEPLSLYRQHGDNLVGARGFSPVARARDLRFMEREFRASIGQAELFREVYGDRLGAQQREEVEAFSSVLEATSLSQGLGRLRESRCLKKGVRQLGQLAMVARVARENRIAARRRTADTGATPRAGIVGTAGAGAGSRGRGASVASGASRIWGGIVTHDPDIARLRENVSAIEPQVERLVVFDNGSANVREVQSAAPHAAVIRAGENLGMAKALNRLATFASEGGATDIVLLDQDSVAAPDLVACEARCRAPEVGIVYARVRERNALVGTAADGAVACGQGGAVRASRDVPACQPVRRAITSGSMLRLSAWRATGGYDERLFVDWVDNEFCDCLRLHGFRVVRAEGASILHELGHQEYAGSGPGFDLSGRAHAGHAYYRQNYPPWRWKDRARSQTITIGTYGWGRIGLEERGLFLRVTLGRVLLLERGKRDNLRAIAAGCREGLCELARSGRQR